MALKMNLFRVVFHTDDATLRNRSFFEIYLRQYPQHDYKFGSATFSGESNMIIGSSIGEKLSRSSQLIGLSAITAVFSTGTKYTSSAIFEGESNMIIHYSIVGIIFTD